MNIYHNTLRMANKLIYVTDTIKCNYNTSVNDTIVESTTFSITPLSRRSCVKSFHNKWHIFIHSTFCTFQLSFTNLNNGIKPYLLSTDNVEYLQLKIFINDILRQLDLFYINKICTHIRVFTRYL